VATVFLPAALQPLVGGAERVEVEAATLRELYARLEARFPGIGEHLRAGLAVAIDGEIISDPLLEPLRPASEVHFLPAIRGG
jgi:molybdopterin converting factor small subunit